MTSTAQILDAVHLSTGVEPGQIVSKSRRHSVLYPRYIALLILRATRPFFSDHELGQLIGIEGHGSTRYALIQAAAMLENDPAFRRAYDQAARELGLQPAGNSTPQ